MTAESRQLPGYPGPLYLAKGTVLTAASDTSLEGLVHWRAPFTSGFRAVVSRGTAIEVEESTRPGARVTYCKLVDSTLEPMLVGARDLNSPKYDGYTILLPHGRVGKIWVPTDPNTAADRRDGPRAGQTRGGDRREQARSSRAGDR